MWDWLSGQAERSYVIRSLYDPIGVIGDSYANRQPFGVAIGVIVGAGVMAVGGGEISAAKIATRGAKYVDTVVPGAVGRASVGSAQVVRTLQSGGNKMLKQTADALNDALGQSVGRRDWGRALEGLKREFGLPGNHHGQIRSTGDYVDEAGNVFGNLVDYLP